MNHGAAGAIVVHTTASASYPFSVVGNSGSRENWERSYRLDLLAWMDSATSARVAASMGTTLPGLFAMAARRDFRPLDTHHRLTAHIETTIRNVPARNVAAVVPGSDSALAAEYVVFTTHFDHLGLGAPAANGDSIFNGAWDNAVGTAGILSIAEAFTAAQPRRSILFAVVTAEEGGTLGSGAFVAVGPSDDGRVPDESAAYHPVSHYGRSKMLAEQELRTKGELLRFVIVRPGAIYGPRERDLFLNFRLIQKGIYPRIGRARRYLNLAHCDDVVRGIILAGESERASGKIYFIASDRVYTTDEIAGAIAEAVGVKACPITVPEAAVWALGFLSELRGRTSHTPVFFNIQKAREACALSIMQSSSWSNRDQSSQSRCRRYQSSRR